MLAKLRPRSVYDVLAAIGFFVAVSTGGAYAANTVFSTDIVDGEVKTADLADTGVTAKKLASGAVTADKLAGQAVTSNKVKDNNLTGADVLDNSLKGADIDESTLTAIGGGPAGGDLTGSYPNPQIAPDAVGAPEIATGAVGPAELGDIFFIDTVESVPPNGGVATNVAATCPPGSQLISGGGWFDFPSGDLASSFPGGGTSWVVDAQNNGNFAQNLRVRAWCLTPPGP